MSENKTLPEIVWILNYQLEHLEVFDVTHDVSIYKTRQTYAEGYQSTPYILKSKYDEALKRIEELEDKLESSEILLSSCKCANDHLTKTIEELKTQVNYFSEHAAAFKEELDNNPYYQICPKCNGQGTVSKPPYVPGDVPQWSGTSTIFTCDVCNGGKTLFVPKHPIQNQ